MVPAERLWIWYLLPTAYAVVRSSAHGQRVWSKKMSLPRAIGLGKQYCSTFTCSSWRNDGFEGKGACTIAYYCLSHGASGEPCQRSNGNQLRIPASSLTSSWVPKITGSSAALQETGAKETTWSCYYAGHRVLQLLPDLQVKFWPYICP